MESVRAATVTERENGRLGASKLHNSKENFMATKDTLSVGVFDDLETAQRSINDLRRAGFGQEEIGIIGHVGDAKPRFRLPRR